MGTKSKIAAIIFNIFSFVLFVMAMLPSNWSNGDGNGGGITVGFAFWVYSVIFALISTLLYTVSAFRALRAGGNIFRLIFSIAILALCIFVGAGFNAISMAIWNVAFALNLIVQICWLRN